MSEHLKAILDKGPSAKSPRTSLNQIEPWIGSFFTFFKEKHFFSYGYNECV
jgi:hypothetical protein